MKKLLYTFLAISFIFSACKKENEEPANSGNNNNSALAIGDTHLGGIIFYLDGNGGGLISAPSDQSIEAEWGCYETTISAAYGTAIGTGYQNTIAGEGCGGAAALCLNLTLGGYSDWFLPSKDELNEIYVNLYSQGIGGFASDSYWSSTEYNNGSAWKQHFLNGGDQSNGGKDSGYYVRAIRAF